MIDADALADALFEKRKNYPQWVADTIGAMPDAVVRCKDCKHWNADEHDCNIKTGWFACGADWFCADGVRR